MAHAHGSEQAGGCCSSHAAASDAAAACDPVCGMTVDPQRTSHRHVHAEHTYYFCCDGCRAKFAADPQKHLDKSLRSQERTPAMGGGHGRAPVAGDERDPVCGMTVDPHTTSRRHVHAGRTYYFCSDGCLAKFAADPQKYLDSSRQSAPPVPAGAVYTCPMHPEIRQVGPGACPICGMALEPVVATADGGAECRARST